MNEKKLEKALNEYLEDNSLEDFLEMFDLTPFEVVFLLYEEGLIDRDLMDRLTPTDV